MTDYDLMCRQLESLSEGVDWDITVLSNASALIWDTLEDINWVGFYLMKDGKLLLGPFQGKPACTVIEVGKGVCGTAIAEDKTQLVKNVHEFPGHIACDCASNAEIVVPLRDAAGFARVRAIMGPGCVAVASAPGRRDRHEEKVTDLLYACQSAAAAGREFGHLFDRVAERYRGIARGIGLPLPDGELRQIYRGLKAGVNSTAHTTAASPSCKNRARPRRAVSRRRKNRASTPAATVTRYMGVRVWRIVFRSMSVVPMPVRAAAVML